MIQRRMRKRRSSTSMPAPASTGTAKLRSDTAHTRSCVADLNRHAAAGHLQGGHESPVVTQTNDVRRHLPMAHRSSAAGPAVEASGMPRWLTGRGSRTRLPQVLRTALAIGLVMLVLTTVASFAYNLATDSAARRPAGLQVINAGGVDTRYRSWGTTGSPVVLVPGAFETADTFARLGMALGTDHRVFALDLAGTGYSQPIGPIQRGAPRRSSSLPWWRTLGLTGADAPVLVGHSSGAAVAGWLRSAAASRRRGHVPRRRRQPRCTCQDSSVRC